MTRRILTCAVFLVPFLLPANGYKILGVRSAKATALGEAFIVQADDPSAVAFNPAGLADLKGLQLSLQSTWCNAYTEHTAPGGGKTDMKDKWQPVPSVFATWDMGTERFTLGLGVSLPNGLSSEWDGDSFARYSGYFSELIIADYTLALGYRIDERLSVGFGLDYYVSKLEQRQRIAGLAFAPVLAFDPGVRVKGTGEAWGFNLGLRYEFNERHAVAATYRRAFTIDYDGEVAVQGVGAFDMDTSFDYPGSVVLGYAYRPNERWTFEANLDWTHWSRVGDVVFDIPALAGQPFAPAGQVRIERDFRNTLAYKFGVQYQCSEALALRFGYIYNENATAEATWNPTQPDTDMHFFTFGFAYDVTESLTLETAFQLVYYETRSIDNDVGFPFGSVDGTYRTWAPCFTLGVVCRF